MKNYFNVELKENDVVDLKKIKEKLIVPEGFQKELNDIEMGQLLNIQLLEEGLKLDSLVQAGGCRVVKASKGFKTTENKSNRLKEYLSKFKN